MNSSSEVEARKYLEDPDALVALVDTVLSKFVISLNGPELRQKQAQLIEVSRSIEQLIKLSIPIPDELRKLKLNLLSEIEAKTQSREEFKKLLMGLSKLVDRVESSNFRKDSTKKQTRKRKQKSMLPNTKEKEYQSEIIDALRVLGGAGTPMEVKAIIEESMKDRFLPGDLEKNLSTSMLVWKTNVHWARYTLKTKGIIISDSPKGVWELSKEYK